MVAISTAMNIRVHCKELLKKKFRIDSKQKILIVHYKYFKEVVAWGDN